KIPSILGQLSRNFKVSRNKQIKTFFFIPKNSRFKKSHQITSILYPKTPFANKAYNPSINAMSRLVPTPACQAAARQDFDRTRNRFDKQPRDRSVAHSLLE